MLWLGEKIISGEKDFSVKSILDSIDRVRPDDLMRVSREIFMDKNLNMSIIGPVKEDKTLKEILHIR